MKKFEYKIETSAMGDVSVGPLNKEGLDGWELIGLQQVGMELKYFFKREFDGKARGTNPQESARQTA
jgi:hypothetical protein